ncbi:MAG TPA: hypothetical protein VF268_08220 [Gammaproteobacteria bacterium]
MIWLESVREGLDIKYLYTYAIDYIVKNRGIDDEDVILEIKEDIEQRVKEDWGWIQIRS